MDDVMFEDSWDDEQEFLEECLKLEEAELNGSNESSGKQIEKRPEIGLESPTSNQLKVLQNRFGHNSFKPEQWKIIQSILSTKRDNCIVMATGYGKSLCYQYPPVYLNQTAMIISPLISLMEDQVLSLEISNVPSCLLGSAQPKKSDTLNNIKDNKYRVVYVTPEFINNCLDWFIGYIPIENLALIAIDEAHCVSQWGHDFRSSYRKLGILKRKFPSVPIVALTATATPTVQEDICKSLNLRNPLISRTSFDRPNIYIEVQRKTSVWHDLSSIMKKEHFLANQMNEFEKGGGLKDKEESWSFSGSTIIYCATRKEVEKVAEELLSHNLEVLTYHAGMTSKQRTKSHSDFVRDRCNLIVCTVAFGMGIDKPDVRLVVHYGAPKDMESYYQEIGRAGRDGLPSVAKVFYSPGDFVTHRHFLNDLSEGKWRDYRRSMIHAMEVYLSMEKQCRRREILRHFDPNHKTDHHPREPRCCDVCTRTLLAPPTGDPSMDGEDEVDFTTDARLLLMAVKMTGGKKGLGLPVLILRGSKDKTVPVEYYEMDAIFGRGKHRSKSYWMALGHALTERGLLTERRGGYAGFGRGNSKFWYTIYEINKFKGEKFLQDENQKLCFVPTADLRPAAVRSVDKQSITDESSASAVGAKVLRFALLSVRARIAEEIGLAPYMVLSEGALRQLEEWRPSSMENLKRISGFVEAKVQRFGQKFVDAIKEKSSELRLDLDQWPPASNEGKEAGLNETQSISLRLFRNLGSLEAVCKERSLKVGTVISHLCEAIKLGSLSGEELDQHIELTPEIRNVITEVIRDQGHSVQRLGPIKELVERKCDVTWDQVKVVVADLTSKYGLDEIGKLVSNKREITKRILPAWMEDPQAKDAMKKKMKFNGLFR